MLRRSDLGCLRRPLAARAVTWPNGEDLAPEPLYEQARAHPLVAV